MSPGSCIEQRGAKIKDEIVGNGLLKKCGIPKVWMLSACTAKCEAEPSCMSMKYLRSKSRCTLYDRYYEDNYKDTSDIDVATNYPYDNVVANYGVGQSCGKFCSERNG